VNIQIRDREPFEQLNPVEVAAYLRSQKWVETDQKPDRFSIWIQNSENKPFEVLLPLRRNLGDYALRMAELVSILATQENRSQLEILSDLQMAGADVVRIRFRHAAAQDGTISLDQGEALVENTREMMFAGACAVLQRKSYFAARKPDEARQFVQNLRMGQTERGSYVLTVFSKVSPTLVGSQKGLFGDLDDPFERRAILQLSESLTALRSATDQVLTGPREEVFQKAVKEGVSANLCSAIVGMNGSAVQASDELRISFTFARSRPVGPEVHREVVIPGDRIGIISEAARIYRSLAPPEETEIRGAVVQLNRTGQTGPMAGPIAVMAFLEGKPRKVFITLDESTHQIAHDAYGGGLEIVCTGDLTRQGNTLVLNNPKGFAITSNE